MVIFGLCLREQSTSGQRTAEEIGPLVDVLSGVAEFIGEVPAGTPLRHTTVASEDGMSQCPVLM